MVALKRRHPMTRQPPKLSAIELSRVLSAAAVGELDHGTFGRTEEADGEACGCVAGTAMVQGGGPS